MTSTSSSNTSPARPETSFVGYLYGLAKRAEEGDGTARGQLARLRRTLTGRSLSFAGLQEVGDALPSNLSALQLDTYLLVAALFAMNPSTQHDSSLGSLGQSLRRHRRDLSAGAESLDRRVTALLDADRDDLPYRLRQVMQQLSTSNHSANYYRLLEDLLRWDHPKRTVQRQWAKHYWVG